MKSITLNPDLQELYPLNEFILEELPEENLQVNLIVEEIFVNIVNYSKTDFITVNVEYEKPSKKEIIWSIMRGINLHMQGGGGRRCGGIVDRRQRSIWRFSQAECSNHF